ncbi:uncharacterized protein LOC131604262 [Vicia villosa]|uniref:uncharacterized protein LOC131604262 n=1 Tax=Vicia villosa TaxID=3911 RepID=UPI00273AFEDF|nr:uncharacterized protein LOC131604262 [Vicia villosa]
MEHLNRLLHKMQLYPDFKHHHRCKDLQLTNIAFADDVLMFFRGDTRSVGMMLKVLLEFSSSIGLVVNPKKCRVYFGGVDADTRLRIRDMTTFQEGELPFKYLGFPMTSRRLEIHHYMPLIGGATIKRKSPVAWHNVCKPRKFGGLNVLDLQTWNVITMMKLLWNISSKKDNLWVRWINSYYMKGQDIMQMVEKEQHSWIFKVILRQ